MAFIYILKSGHIASLGKLSGNFYSIIVGLWKQCLATAEWVSVFPRKEESIKTTKTEKGKYCRFLNEN